MKELKETVGMYAMVVGMSGVLGFISLLFACIYAESAVELMGIIRYMMIDVLILVACAFFILIAIRS